MNKLKFKTYIAALAAMSVTALPSCDDVFEPSLERKMSLEDVEEGVLGYSGVLGYAYSALPFLTRSTTDIATDDATTNDLTSSYYRVATSWTSKFDPLSQWQSRLAVINNLNLFIDNGDGYNWADDETVNKLYQMRMNAEAYALRALNMYYLLINHGGKDANGNWAAFPIFTKSLGSDSDFNLPRNTVQECVNQMFADLDKAIEVLPDAYDDIKAGQEDKISATVAAVSSDVNIYNKVFGAYMRGRVDGRICKAIKSMIALLVVSPSMEGSTTLTWEDAANLAGDVLNYSTGVASKGNEWYSDGGIENFQAGKCPAEILWRGNKDNGQEDYALGIYQERQNFPPTLNGYGRINPSQNLVDAFPMANGYPIDNENSGYDANDPYANRDPRLDLYILHDGSKFKNTDLKTGITDKSNNDGLRLSNNATYTGYYLKKLLNSEVNFANDGKITAKYHYAAYIRFTEIYLNYAEAANEAWGPKAVGLNYNLSAYDVIKAIRERAGIKNTDYLDECATDKEKMRELIRNERRIELCFENKRFWDLRRWKLNLNEPVRGVEIDEKDGKKTYKYFDVAERKYNDYMIYGPIPNSEILKWSTLVQNQGW
jgi:hypothetical protein